MKGESDRTSPESPNERASYGLSDADLQQLHDQGISEETAKQQLSRLRKGTQFLNLHRPAVLGDGIETLNPKFAVQREAAFRNALPRTTGFVPASGAASRMFQDLLESIAAGDVPRADPTASDSANWEASFFDQPWPFQTALGQAQNRCDDPVDQLQALIEGPQGMATLPKALVPFHRSESGEHTAFEEHLREALELAHLAGQPEARVHFTLSPQHRQAIRQLHSRVAERLSEHGVAVVTDSSQHAATDTLALTAAGGPLREPAKTTTRKEGECGPLVLRPGGHGALLRNLEETNAEFVLVKNIDNVQPAGQRSTTLHWKAALLGALVLAQEEVFALAEALEQGSGDTTGQAALALLTRFGRTPKSHSREDLLAELDRPIRLCGVVPNRGEPGGGPFWVRSASGRLSLQIAEGVQIDASSEEQQAILRGSTHFNPVDLACALRDRHGNPFELERFRDDTTYFVATKSHRGETIRALEHPGLWNGAMAHWLTLFVEAPLETFTPVKSVWDLLRPEHQPTT